MPSPTLDIWLHCNNCAVQPSDPAPKGHPAHAHAFALTNCGHVFCTADCLPMALKAGRCQVCGAGPVKAIKVERAMRKDLRKLFQVINKALIKG